MDLNVSVVEQEAYIVLENMISLHLKKLRVCTRKWNFSELQTTRKQNNVFPFSFQLNYSFKTIISVRTLMKISEKKFNYIYIMNYTS